MELKINKTLEYDVVVAGGGTAGVFAAISAARSGAKTLLVEKNNVLGGTMTVANVNYPGLFFAWGKQIIAGPCWEAIERTIALGGAKMPKISFKPQNHWDEQILLNRFIFTTVLFEMCSEAGVSVLCSTMISSAEETENGVVLYITEKSGLSKVNAKCAIDATGDANLAVMSGFEVLKSKELQPATLQNRISGYDVEGVSLDEIKEKFEKASFPKYLTPEKLYGYLHQQMLDIHIPCTDADTSFGKTRLEQNAYSLLLKVYSFLKTIKGLKNLEIHFVAEETGVRETNRIVGEGTITKEDYINGTHYPDSVCYAFYPIDIHVLEGVNKTYHKENVVPKIPYSSLIPKGAKHILTVGRCISSDKEANSAVRVEATCMATGQVAGVACALACQNNKSVGEISLSELLESLEKIGAIVPKN